MTESFFNFQRVFDKHEIGIKNIINYYLNSNNEIVDVSIHGELCGGYYPGVKSIAGAKRVQDRVHYSNDTEIIVFDIRLYNSEGLYEYVPHNEVEYICNKFSVPVVPVLFRGTLSDCLAWSAEHNADQSDIWKIFGLQNEIDGNIREGHVIKPEKTIFKGDHRIIFKDKNAKFKENGGSKIKAEHIQVELSDALMEVLEQVDSYICINRFNSVVSKFGEYTIRNFGELMNLMVEDVEEELCRDGLSDEFTNVDKHELHKILIRKVSSFFVEHKEELF